MKFSLRSKILSLTIGLIILLGLSAIFLIKTTLTQRLLSDLKDQGVLWARHIAVISVGDMLTENRLSLKMKIQEHVSKDGDFVYAYICNSDGKIYEHTFDNGFPSELINANIIEPSEEYSIRTFITERGTILDIAVPVLDGQLGVLHLGVSEAPLKEGVNNVVKLMLLIIIVVLAVGSGTAFVFASIITKPVTELTAAAKEIGRGNLNYNPNISSSDEIGQLALSFNKMAEDLKNTTVSRDYMRNAEEKARAERDKAQNYLDIAGVMLLAIDRDQKVTLINKQGCKILGYEEQEIIGSNWFDRYLPERQRIEIKTVFDRLMNGDTLGARQYENPVLTKNGEERLIAWKNTLLKDENGNITGTLSSGEDITDRVRAENEVRRKQQEIVNNHNEMNKTFKLMEIAKKQWERTMDCVGDMIILTNEAGAIKRTNMAVRMFTGKSYSELLDVSWEDLLHENELSATVLYEGSTELFHSPTGKWFELNAYPFEDTDLNFSGNVITIHETTETKQISEQLERRKMEIEENRNKLKKALDDFSVLMERVIQEKNLDIKFDNPHLKKCYEEKNCGKTDCPCYGKEAMRCWKVAGTYCGGQVQGAFAQKYGHCNQCSVFKSATADPIYQIGEYFNNMMHILRVNNKNLADAYAELKATQSKILQQEKMASVGQLAAGVAHEINNPMGFISSNLGTLGKYVDKLTTFIAAQSELISSLQSADASGKLNELRKKLKVDYITEDISQLISESLEGADRVKKIVQNLKTFSRVDEAEYKHVDINECVESTLNIVWNELKYKATVSKEYGTLPLIKCYPQQLNQVFLNLLVNAAQAIEKQGEIKIRTWNGDGSVNVSISDSGCGIPADKVQKIFEPFYTTKPVGKGTGLGLSITYDIIKKHKGDIKVESIVGSGTVFTVKIPVVEDE
ncbi:MAG: PAS domain S-box protein [Nitrospiraceae bacterium]|nr:MAG: PAS domain S-box protein [Nitrospiraceae bacterium]